MSEKPAYDELEKRVQELEQSEFKLKKSLEALERERRDIQAILDIAPVMIVYKSNDDHLINVNSAFAEFVGLPKEKIVGMTTFDLVKNRDTAKQVRDHDLQVIQTRKPLLNQLVKWSYFHSPKEIWALYSKFPFYDSTGSVIGTISFVVNVDDRVRAEETLRESERKFRDLFDNAVEGLYSALPDGRFMSVNMAFAKMLGYESPEETIATVTDIGNQLYVNPDDRKIVIGILREKGFVKDFEAAMRKKDGSIIEVSINARLNESLLDGNISFEGFITDITERKRGEKERENLQNQLLQAQKMESVGRLAGGVAHDFNNMLSVIIGRAELALMNFQPTDSTYKDLLAIKTIGERSADLTHQLLAFARKQTITPKIIDLSDTIESMLKMLQQLIGEDITLLWKPAINLWMVKMDPAQIDQILANLLVNARDAIKDVGKVVIKTANVVFDEAYCAAHTGFAPGEFVLLAVSDNGCGMNGETLASMFEPFFTTKPIGQGTGLGLAMVYGIVKQNNGFINVLSEPGKGTAFNIYQPRYGGNTTHASAETPKAEAVGGAETILIVEDEPEILDVIKIILTRFGYRLLTAVTPGEAIRLAEEHAGEIHLLMTDVVMPEMNGRDLAGRLLSLHPNLKRLFMSGYTSEIIAHHGVLEQGVHFIQKPFSLKDLAAKVREALS